MNSSNDGNFLQLSNGTGLATCSPVTEINPTSNSDLVFLSLTGSGSALGCLSGGCIMSFSVPTAAPFTFPSTVSSVLPENGGTSGIIIDNTANTPTGTSQVYFTPLANSSVAVPCGGLGLTGVGCAVQASQAGLN